MDIPSVKDISARQLLLSPLNLLHQITTALLPGMLALFLLMLKHSNLIPSALSVTGMLGYKSRVGFALLIAFVLGRVVQGGALLIMKAFGRFATDQKASERGRVAGKKPESSLDSENVEDLPVNGILMFGNADAPPDTPKAAAEQEKLTPEQETARNFFTSILLGTVLAKDGSAFDSWEASRAQLGLMMGSGSVLVLASFYPGDGLRVYECVGGLILLTASLVGARDLDKLKVQAMGNAVGQAIASHSVEENTAILNMAARVLPVVMKHINPTASEREPAEIIAEIAAESNASNPVPKYRSNTKTNLRRK